MKLRRMRNTEAEFELASDLDGPSRLTVLAVSAQLHKPALHDLHTLYELGRLTLSN
jgi:hypothetical protein